MGIVRLLGRLILTGGVVYLLTLAGVTTYSLWQKNPAELPQADMIVCLGAGVDENGVAGPLSIGRARTCAQLYAEGAAPVVLFTGGNHVTTATSSGQAMADIARAEGVPREAMRIECGSHSTLQNALFSKPMIGDAQSLIIVTDAFHMPRSLASFAVMGDWGLTPWTSRYPRPMPLRDGKSIKLHREALAVWFNLARFTIWRGATALGVTEIDGWLH